MSPKMKRLLKKALASSGIVFFALAAYAVHSQLSKYSWMDIRDEFFTIPTHSFVLALMAMAASYSMLAQPKGL